jgi:biotin carboxyl carrier protein
VKLSFEHNSENITIDLTSTGSGKSYRAAIGGDVFEVEILRAGNGRIDFRLIRPNDPLSASSSVFSAYISSDNARRWVTVNGRTIVMTRSSGVRKSRHGHHHTAGELTAPMPGQVRAVNVGEGDSVTKGQTLLLLEAMKMEIRIQSPQDGIVKKLFVEQGQTVEREQRLIEIEEN